MLFVENIVFRHVRLVSELHVRANRVGKLNVMIGINESIGSILKTSSCELY